MFRNLGPFELIIIAIVIFVFFGGKKLPELARGIARASEEFGKGYRSKKADEEKKSGEEKLDSSTE
ncbi:MAG TPA: twin-arginine translocase TatA/TatE family subunit [Patescibacteria group bacterium]|jgi:sec-independent protein translocase protein TatA